jgi:hypothetical protein
VAGLALPPGWDRNEVNRLVRYHSRISWALTQQRTALESALIPITAYILIACIECYRRYPEMMREIAAAMPPEEIGRAGRTPGNEIDTVRLWSIANFPMVGRSVLGGVGMIDWDDDERRLANVFDFWKRAAAAYRDNDGTLQCADAEGRSTPFAAWIDDIATVCTPVDDAERARIMRLNALLTSYEFLLWFDTRAGYQDSGPYPLRDGRRLLLRQFVKLGPSDFAWSHETATDLPHQFVLGAFVLDGVDFGVTDFGTAVTKPEDYVPHVVAAAWFDTSTGSLVPIDRDRQGTLAVAAKDAQKRQYRLIAGMTREEKLHAGAYVYFSFLRPFAKVAGIDDRLDWTVPRDSMDLYPFVSMIEGTPEGPQVDGDTYYVSLPD